MSGSWMAAATVEPGSQAEFPLAPGQSIGAGSNDPLVRVTYGCR